MKQVIIKQAPVVDMTKCMKCRTCISICPQNAISEAPNMCCAKCIKYCIVFPVPCHPEYLIFDYNSCDTCGICLDNCPYDAIRLIDIEAALLRRTEQQ